MRHEPEKTTQVIADTSAQCVDLQAILEELESIRTLAKKMESDFGREIAATDPRFRESAKNLVHYAALRHFDLRPLQKKLARLGLSSLGRAEQHVDASLKAVIIALHRLASDANDEVTAVNTEFADSNLRLDAHISDILGPGRPGRSSRIMVSMPSDTASQPVMVEKLLDSGMDIARVNCAHDDEQTWSAMINQIRQVSDRNDRPCRILMDLAGPKLRTGSLGPGPRVLHIKPRRDALGRVISPKRLRIVRETSVPPKKRMYIPVAGDKAFLASAGDYFAFKDTRGKKRQLHVIENDSDSVLVECHRPAFLQTGTKLKLHRRKEGEVMKVRVGDLPALEQPILLNTGDDLILHKGTAPGKPAKMNAKGEVIAAARISCTLPEVFRYVRVDEPVFLNDGKIEGVVTSVANEQLGVTITHAKAAGSRLRGDKGINFPDSDLHLSGITDKDRQDLDFIARNADAVGLSFVRSPDDVRELQSALAKYVQPGPGIVLKIETEQGFNNLIGLLLVAMQSYPLAVMIARGDLAVECGWERLAEIQEEILWICEAAQVPVIWATQVLESEAKKGRPSRAEISDAAMSQRADCVMLNKGPHIFKAIRTLDNILRRMQAHQSKKTATLRKLSIAGVRSPATDA